MPGKRLFVLASTSPQRKTILKKWRVGFKSSPPHVSEENVKRKKPQAVAKELARRKALAIAKKNTKQWVIGIDTLVALPNGNILGKPKNRQEGAGMIRKYSNSYCDVYSGIAVINKSQNKEFFGTEKTRLFFRSISFKEVTDYIKTNEWKNRSGGMTLEGRGGKNFVHKVEGDYWNVIGLPTLLFTLIKKHIENST